jgi:23S rRNA pseudouridine1911/1915/1917 synthase
MPKPAYIELSPQDRIPILYEDRSILAIDKPIGWMLIPVTWQKTDRNLQAALLSSIAARDFWARSRNIKFLRNIHRLDGETSGILLFAKSMGALEPFSNLFESRQMEKVYLAVTSHQPKQATWTCRLSIGPDPKKIGRMMADKRGKPAETEFRLVANAHDKFLIEARPYTGRTHQIRIHLAESGSPVIGDEFYGRREKVEMGLRAVKLAYKDPFTRKPVTIRAPVEDFLRTHGFGPSAYHLD